MFNWDSRQMRGSSLSRGKSQVVFFMNFRFGEGPVSTIFQRRAVEGTIIYYYIKKIIFVAPILMQLQVSNDDLKIKRTLLETMNIS